MQVMLDDVCAAYDALRIGKTPRLPMVRLQYPDFATWQARQLLSSSLLHQVRQQAVRMPAPTCSCMCAIFVMYWVSRAVEEL